MNSDIQQWLSSEEPDYRQGLALLERYGGNPHLLRHYRERSPRFALPDLAADLERLARHTAAAPTVQGGSPAMKESKAVQTAKKKVHDYWVEASRLQLELHDLGTDNSPESCAARLAVMQRRDAAMEEYNRLYALKEDYFSGKLTEEELKAAVNLKPTKEETAEKAANVSSLSDLELARSLKSKKESLRLTKKKLDLPECPKREQITADINRRQAEVKLLEKEYKKRNLDKRTKKK